MIYTFFEDIKMDILSGPGTLASGTTAYVNVADFERFAVRAVLGATADTVDVQVVQAQDAAGTGSKNVSGALINFTATDDNTEAVVEVTVPFLDDGFGYVAVTLTVAGASTGLVELFSINAGSAPVSQPASLATTLLLVG